ncbi:2OG-Fe(II) oxygenase [Bowmanella dokdonensis]|uniref:2OG-Fe(II) oxygenase n=1 Tax=Bowmanella dokdonensis TaxID=751969 RepID=A0A939IQ97_9ALTE|nr:2OG-Fe(II) oxygenase [Bowmanella dokdonensis]MBN7826710.1 2OG-Fe(II) oxygenase [Bowmanella dokdonensis]
MSKTHFNPSWKNWLRTNLAAGHNKDGLFKILIDEGFDYQAVKGEMGYEPSIPLVLIANPLHARQQAGKARAQSKPVQDKIFLPNANNLCSDLVEMYAVEDFLNEEECCRLVELIKGKLQPSRLSSEESDRSFRTSSTCYLGNMDDPLVARIDQQICAYLGIDAAYGEVIQGQHYQVGQEFKPHTDYFEAHELPVHGAQRGQRSYTFMIYLNDVQDGGETVFPRLGERFSPRRGKAVIWNSLKKDGSGNYHTLHHAKPVLSGEKVIITKWFRVKATEKPTPEMFCKDANQLIPNYTRTGFARLLLPRDLFEELRAFYQANLDNLQEEHVPGNFIVNQGPVTRSSSLVSLTDALRTKVHDKLKPLLEQWCGKPLAPTYVYGIRVYHHGAMLKLHRDRLDTHIISAIINVDQQVNEDWPLEIEDNYCRLHQLVLKPGEILCYEGARLRHGRPQPLNGTRYANIFCHFQPEG